MSWAVQETSATLLSSFRASVPLQLLAIAVLLENCRPAAGKHSWPDVESIPTHTQQAAQGLCGHAGKALETGRGKGDEQTVLKLLQFIGAVSGGKSVTQVALGYLIAKGAAPAPAPIKVSIFHSEHL